MANYYQHHKGGIYDKLDIVHRESDNTKLVLYKCCVTGKSYVRPISEFNKSFKKAPKKKSPEPFMWSDRLIIKFKGIDIGADIASGTTLPEALRAVADSQEALLSGDYEDITETAFEDETNQGEINND